MTYDFLAPHLHPYADAAKKFLRIEKGISGFKREQPIEPNGDFRPTLSAVAKDFHYVCVEVSENAYTPTLDAAILDYRNRIVPVKLYVATPRDVPTANIQQLKQAMRNGIGVLEVDQNGGNIIQEALSQSLTGLRPPDMRAFPSKYRLALSEGVNTFLKGNPSKGCSLVYDEIEALTRKIANKTYLSGSWTGTVSINFSAGSWNNLTETMRTKLNYGASGCPSLNKVLLARVLGITEHRNQTGHKIRRKADLIKRDKELRTRFETATDLLQDLIEAVKPLHI